MSLARTTPKYRTSSCVRPFILPQQRLSDLTPVSDVADFLLGTAWGKICEALKEDFAPYLPIVMPDLLKSASLTPDISFVDGQYRLTLTGRVKLFVLISIADLQMTRRRPRMDGIASSTSVAT